MYTKKVPTSQDEVSFTNFKKEVHHRWKSCLTCSRNYIIRSHQWISGSKRKRKENSCENIPRGSHWTVLAFCGLQFPMLHGTSFQEQKHRQQCICTKIISCSKVKFKFQYNYNIIYRHKQLNTGKPKWTFLRWLEYSIKVHPKFLNNPNHVISSFE